MTVKGRRGQCLTEPFGDRFRECDYGRPLRLLGRLLFLREPDEPRT